VLAFEGELVCAARVAFRRIVEFDEEGGFAVCFANAGFSDFDKVGVVVSDFGGAIGLNGKHMNFIAAIGPDPCAKQGRIPIRGNGNQRKDGEEKGGERGAFHIGNLHRQAGRVNRHPCRESCGRRLHGHCINIFSRRVHLPFESDAGCVVSWTIHRMAQITPESISCIRIKGARQHNLRNIDVEIPRGKFVVVTGLSGSGKSSLAFDTLYAEGQRKYVESLSAYARQFLDKMQKPEVDYIEGLSPAIAIEQRSSVASPRSTIATTTEVFDYLRLLFAAAGCPHDPQTGDLVVRQSPAEICDSVLAWPEGTRMMILAPLVKGERGEFRDVIEKARREGFVRLRVNGELIDISTPQPPKLAKTQRHTIEAVVDRLVVRPEIRARLADSIEVALQRGEGRMLVARQNPDDPAWTDEAFSTDYSNPKTGFSMPKLTPKHFSFNSHLGACPECHGIGTELFFDAALMLDAEKSLDAGAVRPWRTANKRMKAYYEALLEALVAHCPVPRDKPFRELSPEFRNLVAFGSGQEAIAVRVSANKKVSKPFEGLVAQVERLFQESKSEFTKKRLRAFQNRRLCRACRGARLKPEILAVTISSRNGCAYNINDLCALPIREARGVVGELALTPSEEAVVGEVLREILKRLEFLDEVGLGYLQLNRESGTLSGGEAQRIRLATQIGSGLAGVLYVLDEPSIGLHQRDNDRLIGTLRSLRDLGNTVVVVEHDEDTIRAADHLLDLGPGAGPRGGNVVAQGTLEDVLASPESPTAQYLSGRLKIPVPKRRVPPRDPGLELPGEIGDGWLHIRGAGENNLKEIDASIPLGLLTCVTGVSGSGKSTLVNDILRAALSRDLHGARQVPGKHRAIIGTEQLDKIVVIDQSPVGRTPRSNPATYTGAMGTIRDLFSELPSSRVRGYDAGRFSLNTRGGRCEHCEGNGLIKIEMHFLADVYVECEVCRGRRFDRETLEVTYKGKNIADVLEMTIDEARRFFRNVPALETRLGTLQDVGLGYLRLGQPATTLSGGEAQRIKLAAELARRATGRTIYLLDEPTTGLHFADIHKLLEVLVKLRDARNTLVVIEHNLEVIKCADWIIDLGPEGGAEGGRIVAKGTPESVAAHPDSITGRYLARVL
jgi:excinuclease ABC subunit A